MKNSQQTFLALLLLLCTLAPSCLAIGPISETIRYFSTEIYKGQAYTNGEHTVTVTWTGAVDLDVYVYKNNDDYGQDWAQFAAGKGVDAGTEVLKFTPVFNVQYRIFVEPKGTIQKPVDIDFQAQHDMEIGGSGKKNFKIQVIVSPIFFYFYTQPCNRFKITQNTPKQKLTSKIMQGPKNSDTITQTYMFNKKFPQKTLKIDDSSQQSVWQFSVQNITSAYAHDYTLTVECQAAVCGNSVVELGETCDNGGLADCLDCGAGVLENWGCVTVESDDVPVCYQCGNGIKEDGEGCDNGGQAGCAKCVVQYKYSCQENTEKLSTCVPASTNLCGNSKVDQGEDCDNGNVIGCRSCKIELGYQCVGALGATSLCYSTCGDNKRAEVEHCDATDSPGCQNCKVKKGYKCTGALGQRSYCTTKCGDAIRSSDEGCDNGNQVGCSTNCVPDRGYTCTGAVGAPSVCVTVCGDGVKIGGEVCDSGKDFGCSTCAGADDGYECKGDTGAKSVCKSICGDSKRTENEKCDNGNQVGCSKDCVPDFGFTCVGAVGQKSTCTTRCGDYMKASTEACDNGGFTGCRTCSDFDEGHTCKPSSNGKYSICSKR